MKTKKKKISNPYLKGAEYLHKHQVRLGLTLCLVVLLASIIAIVMDPSAGGTVGVLCASAGFMAIGNIDDGQIVPLLARISRISLLINVREQTMKARLFQTECERREVATLPMKLGEKMRYFIAHTIPTLIGTGEKGDVTTTGSNEFVIIMGGKRAQLLNFIEQYAGDKFIIIYKSITDSDYNIIGSYDRPMVLKSYENKNDADGRYVTFTFYNDSLEQSHKYVGNIITTDPAVHDGSATLAIPADNDVISIPSGASTATPITGVSGLSAVMPAVSLHCLVRVGSTRYHSRQQYIVCPSDTLTPRRAVQISFQVLMLARW